MSESVEPPSGCSHILCHKFESHQCVNMCKYIYLKGFGCNAGCQEVSRCCITGEFEVWSPDRWQRMQVRNPPWSWNPGQTLPEVQNSGISSPTKRTCVLQIISKNTQLLILEKIDLMTQLRIPGKAKSFGAEVFTTFNFELLTHFHTCISTWDPYWDLCMHSKKSVTYLLFICNTETLKVPKMTMADQAK